MTSQTQTFSWTQAPDLMARLTTAQNALRTPIDIMTFAGMCSSREQLEAHVAYYEKRVAEQKPQRRKHADLHPTFAAIFSHI
jgi:hypothetical protein